MWLKKLSAQSCSKNISRSNEFSESFSESLWWNVSRAGTSGFNHSGEDYVFYISTDLSAQIMRNQNDGENNDRVGQCKLR